MNLDFKSLNVRDWIYIIGAVLAVLGTYAVMGQDIKHIQEQQDKQEYRDNKQDSDTYNARLELIVIINRQSDEIKQEIRDLRTDVSRLRK